MTWSLNFEINGGEIDASLTDAIYKRLTVVSVHRNPRQTSKSLLFIDVRTLLDVHRKFPCQPTRHVTSVSASFGERCMSTNTTA